MKNYVIIVAGGKGLRVGGDIPKQFRIIGKYPVLMHTIRIFYRYDPKIEIILVLPVSHQEYWKDLCKHYHFDISHRIADGGETRFHSVKNALQLVTETGLVAVHDGVRPFVSENVITTTFLAASKNEAAIPVIKINDSLRKISPDGSSQAVPRSQYCIVQTPQVFGSKLLKQAYEQPFSENFTDDASVVEAMGNRINTVEGNTENIKITTPQDLLFAELLSHNV